MPRVKRVKTRVEKGNISWNERFDKLARTVEARFKKRGITKKDIERANEAVTGGENTVI